MTVRGPRRAASRHPGDPDRRREAGRETREASEALVWAGLVAAGLALTAVAVHLGARVGSPGAPFTGTYRIKFEVGTLLAPAVAATVLAAARAGVPDRLGWRAVLAASYVASVAWALSLALVDGGNGLASPVTAPGEYLRDVPAVGSDPVEFVDGFVEAAGAYEVATRTHPPGPVLTLWALQHVGVTRPQTLGLLITLVGCASVPLLGVAVRSLCHESAARRFLPVLVLAPYAVWLAVSMDAVTLALAAAFVTCGVLASEPGRSPAWAVASGLLLGVAALFNYAVGWLGVSVIAVYFVRRRPLLNVVTGAAALVPLSVAYGWGFAWTEGLSVAQADLSVRVGPHRSWLLWAFLDLLLLLLACGPAVLRAGRRLLTTPGWPFVVGAGLAVVFAIGSGLARGEVERSWLAFYPFLLVPAVAPLRRPGPGDPDAGPTPLLLVAVGAAGAVVVECLLRTTW